LVLVAAGMVIVLWGGFFWTKKDTILDAGPLHVTTEKREGRSVPPVVGAALLVGGMILVLVPGRKRV
jgi:hypothetical protein